MNLDDYADEYHTTVVAPRETARAAIDADYAAAVAAIESERAAKYAAAGIDVTPKTRTSTRTPGSTAGKSRIFRDDATITVISENHGLRAGAVNLARFELLKQVSTVRGAHQLGVDNGYLRFYVERGLITIA